MRGHLRERSKGTWALVIEGERTAQGKRQQHWHTFHGTRRQAESELTRLLHLRQSGGYVEPSRITLGDFLQRWLTDQKRHALSPASFDRYEAAVRVHIIPSLGSVTLPRLTALQIQRYYSEALEKLSARSVSIHHQLLGDALRTAVRWRLIAVNPIDGVEPPRAPETERPTLSREDVARLLKASEGTRYYLAVLLAVTTGMRRGEILALRWEDVDLPAGRLSVARSLEKSSQGVRFKDPKTRRGRRPIELPTLAVEALVRHKAAQSAQRLALGPLYQAGDLVYPREDGTPFSPSVLSRAFAELAASLGFPQVHFHDLRHTHATLLLEEGVNPKVVAERLGHSGVSMTLDRYSHVLPHLQEEAARRLDATLRRAIG